LQDDSRGIRELPRSDNEEVVKIEMSHGKMERLPFQPQQKRSRGALALRPRLGAEKVRSIYRDPRCGNCALDLSTGEVSIHVISPECECSNIGPSVRC
jgi:hypothetical protein